jgi:hypothetical protein
VIWVTRTGIQYAFKNDLQIGWPTTKPWLTCALRAVIYSTELCRKIPEAMLLNIDITGKQCVLFCNTEMHSSRGANTQAEPQRCPQDVVKVGRGRQLRRR